MRPGYVLFCLCLQLSFFAQQTQAQRPQTVTLDHIALAVRNVDSSTLFYQSLFHFDTLPHPRLELRYQWLAIGDGRALHMVESLKDTVSLPFMLHFCFSIGSIDEFAAKLDQLRIPYYSGPDLKRGFRLRPDGVKQLFFKDPDRYWVEVNNAKHP